MSSKFLSSMILRTGGLRNDISEPSVRIPVSACAKQSDSFFPWTTYNASGV